jgi:hypothetical protein
MRAAIKVPLLVAHAHHEQVSSMLRDHGGDYCDLPDAVLCRPEVRGGVVCRRIPGLWPCPLRSRMGWISHRPSLLASAHRTLFPGPHAPLTVAGHHADRMT